MDNPTKLSDRLSLVASKMTLQEPFIAAVYAKLERIVVTHGTASTNGSWVKFSTEFCDKLSDEELFGLSLHEAMHVILMHPWRREGRNPGVFNIACDAFINVTIAQMGYALPSGGVDIPWVTTEMGAEEIYAKLYRDNPNAGDSGQSGADSGDAGGDDGGGGSSSDGAGDDTGDDTGGDTGAGGWDGTGDMEDAPDKASEADMEATIVTAAKMAKICGQGNSLTAMILDGSLAPKVSWAETLRQVMTAANRDDYTYGRLNKRYLSMGLYLPSLYSEGMGGMVIAVDTSGSMGQAELDQVASEINAIFEDCSPEWVEVVYCDSHVTNRERFHPGDPIELHAVGGGGTRFEPVFEFVEKMGEKVAVLVYFTDLCGNLNSIPEPEYPTIWGTTYGRGNHAVPFGEVVEVTV